MGPIDRRSSHGESSAPVAVLAYSVLPDAPRGPSPRECVQFAQSAQLLGIRPDRVVAVVVLPEVQPPGPQPSPDRVPADSQMPGQTHLGPFAVPFRVLLAVEDRVGPPRGGFEPENR